MPIIFSFSKVLRSLSARREGGSDEEDQGSGAGRGRGGERSRSLLDIVPRADYLPMWGHMFRRPEDVRPLSSTPARQLATSPNMKEEKKEDGCPGTSHGNRTDTPKPKIELRAQVKSPEADANDGVKTCAKNWAGPEGRGGHLGCYPGGAGITSSGSQRPAGRSGGGSWGHSSSTCRPGGRARSQYHSPAGYGRGYGRRSPASTRTKSSCGGTPRFPICSYGDCARDTASTSESGLRRWVSEGEKADGNNNTKADGDGKTPGSLKADKGDSGLGGAEDSDVFADAEEDPTIVVHM